MRRHGIVQNNGETAVETGSNKFYFKTTLYQKCKGTKINPNATNWFVNQMGCRGHLVHKFTVTLKHLFLLFIYPFIWFFHFFFQGNNVVPLIKFFSFLCVFLGFALLVLRMEYQPSFAKNWFNEPVEQPLEMTPFDWEIETTKSTDFAREGGSGKRFNLFRLNLSKRFFFLYP